MSDLTTLAAVDAAWQKGYHVGSQHPVRVARTEQLYLHARLHEADAVIRLARLGYADEAHAAAVEYLRKYGGHKLDLPA